MDGDKALEIEERIKSALNDREDARREKTRALGFQYLGAIVSLFVVAGAIYTPLLNVRDEVKSLRVDVSNAAKDAEKDRSQLKTTTDLSLQGANDMKTHLADVKGQRDSFERRMNEQEATNQRQDVAIQQLLQLSTETNTIVKSLRKDR